MKMLERAKMLKGLSSMIRIGDDEPCENSGELAALLKAYIDGPIPYGLWSRDALFCTEEIGEV